MDNMIFTSEVCGVVLIAPFDKISRPPCSTIRFIVFLSLFFRCFYPFFLYHRIFLLTVLTAIGEKPIIPSIISAAFILLSALFSKLGKYISFFSTDIENVKEKLEKKVDRHQAKKK